MIFARKFDVDAVTKASPAWWEDLLRLWQPNGVSSGSVQTGDYGLRLAVRDGYLNFYRRGQSVARVEFDRKREPVAFVHAKYVFPKEKRTIDREYVRVSGETIYRAGKPALDYRGLSMLREWAAEADRYAGSEKKAIDAVLDRSGDVIDLEMGQPGTALRMDIVSIETGPDGLCVGFWEAKRARDKRVRCEGPCVPDQKPDVLKQLRDYKSFIEADSNRERVDAAYRRTAGILVHLREIANSLGPSHSLGANIVRAAASTTLGVRSEARLLIFHDDEKDRAWEDTHSLKLKAAGVSMLVQSPAASVSLGEPA